MAQDLPLLDDSITQLSADVREDIAELARGNLFLMAKILGNNDITKACHGPMCAFLDRNPSRFKLVMMPRGHFKTSVATISRVTQKITQNAEVRIMLANETHTNSQRFLSSIRSHMESNQIFRALFSDMIPKDFKKTIWNQNEIRVNRQGHYPEPTVDTIGMTGAMTSRHFNHITFDDCISEEAAKSERVMEDVIGRMTKIISLMVNAEEDTYDLIGTRWAFHDVYSYMMAAYGGDLARYIRGAVENDTPIFPERFSLETLSRIRSQPNIGEYVFSCQYMNNPRNPELQDFNIEDLRYWRWSGNGEDVVLYDRNGEIHKIVAKDDLDITVAVDLAPAEKVTSDRNAVVVTGVTADGDAVVLDVFAKRCTPLELMEELFRVQQVYRPRVIGIEGVAYQKAFKYFLKSECDRRGIWMSVVELKAVGKKETRIRGLQPVAATGHLYIHPRQHTLRNEMADFPLGEHDDTIDALAYHLQLWRGLMSTERWERYKDSERQFLKRLDADAAGMTQDQWDEFFGEPDDDDPGWRTHGPISEVSLT